MSYETGVYRGLLSTLWDDDYIVSLADSRQVLFFIFCVNNRRQTPSGFYRATPEQLWSDFRRSDVSVDDVRSWLLEFHEAGKVISDRGWMWVVNFVRHRRELNPAIARSIVTYLNTCSSRLIFDQWMKKYKNYSTLPEFFAELEKRGHVIRFGGAEEATETAAPRIPAEKPEKHLFDNEVRDVWGFYCETMRVQMSLTPTRRDKIISRLKDKITDPETGQVRAATVADLLRAIRACANSDFHMGREDGKYRGKMFNVLEQNILKDQEQLEQWLSKGGAPARPTKPTKEPIRRPTKEELRQQAGPVGEFPKGAEEIKQTADRVLQKIREQAQDNGGEAPHVEEEGEVVL
jgi:hypothetical protein